MGTPNSTARLARAVAATVTAGLALALAWLSCILTPGCGFDPRQFSAAQPTQTYNVTDLDTGDEAHVAVAPAAQTPTPGVRIELTEATAGGSVLLAIAAVALAWTARRKANGVQRNLDQWRSSPPAP